MKLKYTGAVGEHYVLSQLLLRNIEAYLAVKANQKGFDIVAMNSKGTGFSRIEVKAQNLLSGSTNNSFSLDSFNADFLIVVIIEGIERPLRSFIFTRDQIPYLLEGNKHLKTSEIKDGMPQVYSGELFLQGEHNWEIISNSFN